jgi:hypothetical protein
MISIDNRLPDLGLLKTLLVTIVLAIGLQFTGLWIMMIVVGGISGLFLRRLRDAFLVGFVGVALAWLSLYVFIVVIGNAMLVADFFAALLGLTGFGWLVMLIGCIIGGLLGGFGAILSRAIIESVDDIMSEKT